MTPWQIIGELIGKYWPVVVAVFFLLSWITGASWIKGIIEAISHGIKNIFTPLGFFIFAALGILGWLVYQKALEIFNL